MPARGQGSTYQGYKWCWPPTRYAIYWRDRCHRTGRFRCVWCNRKASFEDVISGRFRLSLDHLDPWSRGGTNDPTNLVTSCLLCNGRRGGKSYAETHAEHIFPWHAYRRVERVRVEPLDRKRGRVLAAHISRPWRKPPILFDRDTPMELPPPTSHREDEMTEDPNDIAPF